MSQKPLLYRLLCLGILFLFCACGEEKQQDRQVFRMNLESGLNSLDPAFAKDQASGWMCAQIFSSLVELDSQLQVKPLLARSWELSEDGKSYVFHLRKDVFFHKHAAFGKDSTRRLNAEDVVYSFTRICSPKTASSGSWIFRNRILGLKAYEKDSAKSIAGFQALNDSTLRIELEKPFPAFLSLLAMPYTFIVPREVVEAEGENFGRKPIGTGAFRFFKWEEGNALVLHKNPQYFESGLPYLDAVSVRFMPSRLSAFIAFTQGKLDFLNSIDNAYKDELLSWEGEVKAEYRQKYKVYLAPQLNTEYMGMMTDDSLKYETENPFLDKKVRQALNYATDRGKLVKYLLNGMGYASNSGFIPKGMPGFNPEIVKGYHFNPEKATQLLQEAGYSASKPLKISLNTTPTYSFIAEFLQKEWERFHIQLKVNTLQGGTLRKEVSSGKVNFWRASWIGDYPDGENYLALFYSKNKAPQGPNTTHFRSATFDKKYENALLSTNDSARQAIYQQMEQELLEAAPIIPLYYDRIIRLTQKNVSGLSTNAMNHLSLKTVRVGK